MKLTVDLQLTRLRMRDTAPPLPMRPHDTCLVKYRYLHFRRLLISNSASSALFCALSYVAEISCYRKVGQL
jgi:hypothetical protein